jgi:hypothetical protein
MGVALGGALGVALGALGRAGDGAGDAPRKGAAGTTSPTRAISRLYLQMHLCLEQAKKKNNPTRQNKRMKES